MNGVPTYTDLVMRDPQVPSAQMISRYARGNFNGPFVQDVRYIEQYYELPEQKKAFDVWTLPSNEKLLPPMTPTQDAEEQGRMAEHRKPQQERATGYQPYGYLRPGIDFREFELAPEFGRVPPYTDPATEDERARAARLLTDSVVISLHDHPVRFPARMEQTPEFYRTGRQHTAYAGLLASGMTAVFDNKTELAI